MLKVYLAGEIHTNWREEIIENCKKENLDIKFSSPQSLKSQHHNYQMKSDRLQEMKI